MMDRGRSCDFISLRFLFDYFFFLEILTSGQDGGNFGSTWGHDGGNLA